MKFQNIHTQRLLVLVGREKVWVAPGEFVFLSAEEARKLGENAKFIVKQAKRPRGTEITDDAPSAKAAVETVRKVLESKDQRALVKTVEENFMTVAKESEKKESIITRAINAARVIGYDLIIKKLFGSSK